MLKIRAHHKERERKTQPYTQMNLNLSGYIREQDDRGKGIGNARS